jgi:hypothetical protein
MLTHWIEQQAWCKRTNILWTSLAATVQKQRRKGMIASPIMRELYSRAWFWLRVLKTQPADSLVRWTSRR